VVKITILAGINMARPTVMTREMITSICFELAGGRSLASVCRQDDMPAMSTVLLAVVDDRDGFRSDYIRAREAAGFSHADRLIDVADKIGTGELDPQQGKAMNDAYKWAAERMSSKYHSSNQKLDLTSSDGTMKPTMIEIVAPDH
jgi:hypothetical protein